MAPRKRKSEKDKWMPPRVYRGKSAYEWRPKGGGCVRLCGLDASEAQVWSAYEKEKSRKEEFTFTSLVALFLNSEHFRRLKKTTRDDYEDCSTKVLPVFGKMLPDSIKTPMIRKYMDIRGEKSIARANREKVFIGVVFAWGYERGYTLTNPAKGIKAFRQEARERYVTDAEYQAVYNIAPPVIQVAMEIAYLCAARQRDVLDLKWGRPKQTAPDKGQNAIVLEQGLYIRQGKTGKRQVKLWTPRLKAAIESAKNLHGTSMASLYVLHNRQGQPYTSSGFKALWKRYRDKAMADGLIQESFTYHDLKAKGISDYEGDKQAFSGHLQRSQMERYNRKPEEVKAHDPDAE